MPDEDSLTSFFLQTGAVYEDYYTDADLVIGAVLNVWGRKLVICGCDDFSKEFYKSKYGIGQYCTDTQKSDIYVS